MGAVWYRARAGLRRSMGTTAFLVLLVAVPSAVVLAVGAGALRARDALPDFLAYNNGQDASTFIYIGALPPDRSHALTDEIAALPQWEAVGTGRPVVVSLRRDDHWITQVMIAVESGPFLTGFDRPLMVEGRLPEPDHADEVFVNEAFAHDLGLHAGDTFRIRTVTPSGLDAASAGTSSRDPSGENMTMTVAGIGRRPVDLANQRPSAGESFGADSWFVQAGPAFLDRFGDRLATYGFAAQGRVHAGQGHALSAAVADLGEPSVEVQLGSESEEIFGTVDRAIDFETNALLLFALVAAITSIALVGQVISRRAHLDLDGDDALRAAGLSRRHRAVVPLVRAGGVGVAGGVLAVAIALAVSPAFPVGLARDAELDTGVDVDPLVIIGGLLVALGVLAVAALVGWQRTRRGRSESSDQRGARPSSVTGFAARAGAPVTAVSGIRFALERGRGRTAVPVVGAMVATTAGIAALTAVLVFSASLDHLVSTPALQGWTWDGSVTNMNDEATANAAMETLGHNPDVESFRGFASGPVVIDGQGSYTATFGGGDPAAGPVPVDGRAPRRAHEVALGRQTLDDLGKDIGDEVELALSPGAPTYTATIVGTVVLPAALDRQLTLGRGVVLDGAAWPELEGQPFFPNTLLVNFAEGVTEAQGLRSLRHDFGPTASGVQTADDVENLRRVRHLPALLAALVGLLALGTLINTLVTSVRRRRRDLATFVTLGFRRRQLASTVAWQATTFALIALAAGLPLGIGTGRLAWRLVMDSMGLTAEPVAPTVLLLALAVAALVLANLIATLPARSAARTLPAEILHSE